MTGRRPASVAPLLLVALTLAACRPEPPPVAPPEPEAAPAEPVAEAPPPAPAPKPPPPEPPEWGDLLDAALGGPVPLTPEVRAQLRLLELDHGDQPVWLPDGRWPAVADALLDEAAALPSHDLEVPQAEVDALADLRAELVTWSGWTGDRATDIAHAQRVVHAEHALVRLFLRLAKRHAALRVVPPEAPRAAETRLLDALAAASAPEAVVATLPTPIEAYQRLREALADYRGLVDEGGFLEVPDSVRKARPGKKREGLVALRARLAQEDPEGAGEGEVWDDDLTDALRRARRAYQLPALRKKKRLLDKALLAELRVPAGERLAAIRWNLKRLRHSALRDHPYAIYINLPDYHGEVWDGPERLHRFKIVIGNTKRQRGRMINATPELTARVDTVIYNPWWTVPRRIYEQELLVKAEKWAADQAEKAAAADPAAPPPAAQPPPDYWEAKGYEVKQPDNPERTWVRRRPGPGNALGKVKFIFENRSFVFLHDTPSKKKFRPTRRAFSHGCMRVHEPLVLAELLLSRDGTWGEAQAARVMQHYKETPIQLRDPVPLVVEYVTTRMDDAGRVHFLADVYRKDPPMVAQR